ncbi:serine--tRNA ligase [Helicobacter zhangjianzhongii]|uniref:serine--tRNA ligase n=1 Tax=Helicobacter zhangjianzhongii TaxID=2974574 RepID=UPI003D9C6E94
MPNLPDSHTPEGADESANIELKRILTPREFDFTPKEHFELAEQNGWIDFAAGVKLAKSRFSVLRGQGALLSRALINFMIDSNRKAGFELVSTPVIVNSAMLFGTGQLPKFEDDMFKICGEEDSRSEAQNLESTFENATTLSEQQKVDSGENAKNVSEQPKDSRILEIESGFFKPRKEIRLECLSTQCGDEIHDSSPKAESTNQKPTPKPTKEKQKGHSLYLISTSEITLTNLYNDCIISAKDLPICLTAQTPCFRKEAGSAGRDTRGIIREHQFDKVELVAITHPSQSDAMQELMLRTASKILSDLELPHRFMRLCSGDLGFSASNTIDIEVWLPGQGCYREISSVSNTRDFQARRAKIRYKENGKNHFAHTLNGSSLAVGRTLVAIMENYQQKDGSIAIPKVLEPYL